MTSSTGCSGLTLVGIAAERGDAVAHRGQVDDAGHAGEVLQQHPRRHERDLAVGRASPPDPTPASARMSSALTNAPSSRRSRFSSRILQRERQPLDTREASPGQRRQAEVVDGPPPARQGGARLEGVQAGHDPVDDTPRPPASGQSSVRDRTALRRHLRIRPAECRRHFAGRRWHDIRSRDPSCAISSTACGCCGGPRDWPRRRSSRSASASAPPPPSSAWCAHVLLRPLPFADPDRLVVLWETSRRRPRRAGSRRPTSSTGSATPPASSTAWPPTTASPPPSPGDGEPERLRAVSASGTFFAVLGQQAAEGRTLDAGRRPARRAVRGGADRRVAQRRFGTTSGRRQVARARRPAVRGGRRAAGGVRVPAAEPAPSCGSTAIAACRAASRSRATSPPCATRTCSTSSAGCADGVTRRRAPRPRCRR